MLIEKIKASKRSMNGRKCCQSHLQGRSGQVSWKGFLEGVVGGCFFRDKAFAAVVGAVFPLTT